MRKYIAEIMLDNKLEKVEFECEAGEQVNWLWEQYGMSTYIATVNEVESNDSDKLKD